MTRPPSPATLRPLKCARPGCGDRYDHHAPGGGGCMFWDAVTGEHCDCCGFQWVPLSTVVDRSFRLRS